MALSRRSERNQRSTDDAKKRNQGPRLPLILLLTVVLVVMVFSAPFQPVQKEYGTTEKGVKSKNAGLVISEVMPDNATAYPDEKGKFGDWIEIYNTLEEPMNLAGVGLSDRSDRIKFIFPNVTLAAGGRVVVFLDGVNRDSANGTFHAKFKLSSLGETVYLFDASGTCIDSVKLPTLNSDESYARMEDETFEKTYYYSPGYENTQQGYEAYRAAYSVIPGMLMINEVAPSPKSGLRDEDGDYSDWIELYNMGDTTIRLSNFALSDDESKPIKWIFPQNATIEPGGYYIVYCSGKDKVESTTNFPHTNFSINNGEETLLLTTLSGELVDRVVVKDVPKDMSYGRDPNTLLWKIYELPTPYRPNNEEGAYQADLYIRTANLTGVYISEVMASADSIVAVSGERACDYVEIYNSSSQTVNLSGWGLSDNVNWLRKWTFPTGTFIFPGEYKVILLDKSDTPGTDGSKLHANFAISRSGGEIICMSDPSGVVLDRIYLPEIPTDVSYGRTLGINGFFYYEVPTPGAKNTSGFRGYAAKPVFGTPSGLYSGEVTVSIQVPEGTTVRYTTDGSIPTVENGIVYTGPFTITETGVYRARSFQGSMHNSDTVTVSYIMNTYHTLDVVSIVCDPDELWNTTNGLLYDGPDLNKCTEVNKSKLPFRTPVYRTYGKIDRPGYVEFFDIETGQAYISQGVKMDLMGDYSLDMPQKSFKFRAQASMGAKYFESALFEEREYTYYKSFTLRNSGNDNVFTRVADGVQTRLIDKYLNSCVLTLAWRPVVVYLNGEYWGHYNLRERKDRFSIAQYEGLDLEDKDMLESITILRANWTVVQGSNEEYRAMLKEIEKLKPNGSEADLQYLYDHIDVDNYLDWFAIKMFLGDSDPGNIMFYKLPGEDSKWKCLMFDLDYGLFNSSFNSPWSYMKEAGMGEQKINNVIFRKLLESDQIREQFFYRIGEIYQLLTTNVMLEELKECTSLIYPELTIHYSRWARFSEKTINSDSPITADGYMRYWQQRVDRMKNTMTRRPYLFWGYFQEQFKLTDREMEFYFGERPANPDQ